MFLGHPVVKKDPSYLLILYRITSDLTMVKTSYVSASYYRRRRLRLKNDFKSLHPTAYRVQGFPIIMGI